MLSSTARPKLLALLLVCLVAAVAAPAAASAAAGTGTVTLGVGGKGKAAKALEAAGVRTSAIKPAKKRAGARFVLPVASIAVAKSAKVGLRGGIAFRAGKRTAKLKSLRIVVSARRATVSAKVGKARRTFFTASLPAAKTKLDRAKLTAAAAGGKLALTRAGAKLLRKKLGAPGILAGALGSLAADARQTAGSGGGGGGGTNPGGGGPGGGGQKPVCQSGPESGDLPPEPPIASRPPGAGDVTSASLVWRPRESWIRYINGGDGTSVQGGFTNGPLENRGGSSLVYSFLNGTLVPGKSWAHPDGRAVVYFSGAVRFSWMTGPSPHCINFTASDPEIEIVPGGASRAIFRFNGSDGTPFPDRRGVLVDLAPGTDQDPGLGGNYPAMPGTIPAGTGGSVFAGFYGPGTDFGTIDLFFTTP